jgi:hypothetical protein
VQVRAQICKEQGEISWKNSSSKTAAAAAFKSAPAPVFLAPVEAAFGVPAHVLNVVILVQQGLACPKPSMMVQGFLKRDCPIFGDNKTALIRACANPSKFGLSSWKP